MVLELFAAIGLLSLIAFLSWCIIAISDYFIELNRTVWNLSRSLELLEIAHSRLSAEVTEAKKGYN